MTGPRYFSCESSLFFHCPFVFSIFETVLFCVAVSSDQIFILCTAKTTFCDWSFLGIFAYAYFVLGSVCICCLVRVLALSFRYSITINAQELSELGPQTLDKAVFSSETIIDCIWQLHTKCEKHQKSKSLRF